MLRKIPLSLAGFFQCFIPPNLVSLFNLPNFRHIRIAKINGFDSSVCGVGRSGSREPHSSQLLRQMTLFLFVKSSISTLEFVCVIDGTLRGV